jgi:hypothetical protein
MQAITHAPGHAGPQKEQELLPESGISGTLCQEGFAVENSVHPDGRILRRGRDGVIFFCNGGSASCSAQSIGSSPVRA